MAAGEQDKAVRMSTLVSACITYRSWPPSTVSATTGGLGSTTFRGLGQQAGDFLGGLLEEHAGEHEANKKRGEKGSSVQVWTFTDTELLISWRRVSGALWLSAVLETHLLL